MVIGAKTEEDGLQPVWPLASDLLASLIDLLKDTIEQTETSDANEDQDIDYDDLSKTTS